MLSKAEAAHEEPAKEKKKKAEKKESEVPSKGKPQATAAGDGPPPAKSSAPESEDEGPAEADSEGPSAPTGEPQADGGDQGGGDADSPQPDQDQGAQGADAGGDAGDTEQGAGQDASPQGAEDDSAPGADAGQGGPQATQQAGANPDHVDLSQIPISPALKEEYIKANGALLTALYQNDKVAQAVLQAIVPQGVHKLESVVHISLTLFFQIDKQLHFMQDAKQIAMPFLNQVVAHVIDLASQVKQIPFSDQETSAAVSAAQEMLLRIHGVTKGQMKAVAQHLPKSQLQDQLGKYQAHAKAVHNVTGRFNQQAGGAPPPGNQAPPQGGQPANGGPPATEGAGAPSQGGGPPQGTQQGSPPQGTPGGQPQPGAPVTAAPGQGQSAPPGGMLSQAANQPPGQ
jgi:hypothetical protein